MLALPPKVLILASDPPRRRLHSSLAGLDLNLINEEVVDWLVVSWYPCRSHVRRVLIWKAVDKMQARTVGEHASLPSTSVQIIESEVGGIEASEVALEVCQASISSPSTTTIWAFCAIGDAGRADEYLICNLYG